jgi:hypothetical protein
MINHKIILYLPPTATLKGWKAEITICYLVLGTPINRLSACELESVQSITSLQNAFNCTPIRSRA